MQLRYLKTISLKKANRTRLDNGAYTVEYTLIGTYKAGLKHVFEDVHVESAGATNSTSRRYFGSDIRRDYELNTPLRDLESFLLTKMNNSDDNISNYFIEFDNEMYRITDVGFNRPIEISRI